MKKFLQFSFIPLSIIACILIYQKKNTLDYNRPQMKSQLPHIKQTKAPALPKYIDRSIASTSLVKNNKMKTQKKKTYNHLVKVLPNSFGLPHGYQIAQNLRAIKIDNYRSDMGEQIFKDKNFAYFKYEAIPDDTWEHVAYDSKNQIFYPISTVLKVEKVDLVLRDKIISQGHNEFYYRSDLKLLYLKTEKKDLMATYEDLRSQSFKLSFEILTPANLPH